MPARLLTEPYEEPDVVDRHQPKPEHVVHHEEMP
jgi:hypothetical protein